jgi:hypothetical protein
MTFTEGVLRLVRVGTRVDSGDRASFSPAGSEGGQLAPELVAASVDSSTTIEPSADSFAVELFAADDLSADGPAALSRFEPGFSDIEAAVALVEAGLATRVVLTGFPSWPGLLWQAYQLAEAANVLILPTVVRPGGKVDIVITRDIAGNG